ncbi:MAG: family 16 glycoside hydrolase [Mycobacteriales bacterium]
MSTGSRGRLVTLVVMIALVAAVAPVRAASTAAPVAFSSPAAFGAVELGREVAFSLRGAGCAASRTHAQVRFGDQVVIGRTVRGCSGTVVLPSTAAVLAKGWREGTRLEIELVSGARRVPLRHKHLEPDLGVPVSGTPTVVPADTDTQGDANALAMTTGDVVDLGPVNLTGVYAIAVRSAGGGGYELRLGSADGLVVAHGSSGFLASNISPPIPDWSIRRPGWTRNPWLLSTAPVAKAHPGARHLFLAATSGASLFNFIDLTGSGVMAPYRRPPSLAGAHDLFNGKDLRGWKHVGDAGFVVKHGYMEAQECPPNTDPTKFVACIGFLYWTRKTYHDFHLRVDFSLTKFGDNGGVLIRHDAQGDYQHAEEIQLTDVNTEFVGGIDHVQEARRQPQSSPGQWSTMDIIAQGPRILVAVNGIITSLYDGTAGCGITAQPCYGGANGGYDQGGIGYVSMENEVGKVRFRDIEMYECRGAHDPQCVTDDVDVLLPVPAVVPPLS